MRHRRYDGSPACPVEACAEVIGGKWKGAILHHLLGGTKRFGELRALLCGVTQRMLTQQLRELEAAGLVDRRVYAVVPPKVEYSLTSAGRSLEPLVCLMREWGTNHLSARAESPAES